MHGLFNKWPLNTPIELMLRATLQHQQGDFHLDVDITLENTNVCAVFGPSGCGKTTLLRALAGLVPARGQIRFKEQCWQSETAVLPAHARSTGLVFQDNRLFPHLNVADNLAFATARAPEGGLSYEDIVDTLGVRPLLSRSVSDLSGGEAKRVAIARTLLNQPRLLMMDEPLNGLDQYSKKEVLLYLAQLTQQFNLPTLYVSHDIEEVAGLCDYMLVMASGKVTDHGSIVAVTQRLHRSGGTMTAAPKGAVIEATVNSHEPAYSLTRLDLAGHTLFVPMQNQFPSGKRIRLFLPARDVAVATAQPQGLSIRNSLPGIVESLHPEANNRVKVAIRVADQLLFAEVTRHAKDALSLHEGMAVFALIKSVALG